MPIEVPFVKGRNITSKILVVANLTQLLKRLLKIAAVYQDTSHKRWQEEQASYARVREIICL